MFIPLDSVNNNAYVNQLKSYVPGFVYAYYSDHKQSFKQYNSVESFDQNFVVNADLMNLFLSYAESKEWKKDMSKMPANEKNLKQFMKAFFAKQLFQNEGYFKILFQQDPYIKEALQQFK